MPENRDAIPSACREKIVIEHKSPPRLRLVRKTVIKEGKNFIEKWIYEDDRGKEHIKTVKQSKYF